MSNELYGLENAIARGDESLIECSLDVGLVQSAEILSAEEAERVAESTCDIPRDLDVLRVVDIATHTTAADDHPPVTRS